MVLAREGGFIPRLKFKGIAHNLRKITKFKSVFLNACSSMKTLYSTTMDVVKN